MPRQNIRLNRFDSPCKDCPKRAYNCWSTCEEYQEFNKKLVEDRKQRFECMEDQSFWIGRMIRSRENNRRHNRGKGCGQI